MASALALDIGGTSVRCAFLRSDGEVSGYTEVKTNSNSDAQEEILTTILSCVRGRMSSAGNSTLEGIGVGVPGAVTGRTHTPSNIVRMHLGSESLNTRRFLCVIPS